MSTSVYRSEQVVHYGGTDAPEDAKTYHGFYISWSGGEDDSAYPFNSAERRADWEKAVLAAMPEPTHAYDEPDDYDALLAAAMTACAVWGPESSQDGVDWALEDHYGKLFAAVLRDLASRFDPSEPPGTPLAPETPSGDSDDLTMGRGT